MQAGEKIVAQSCQLAFKIETDQGGSDAKRFHQEFGMYKKTTLENGIRVVTETMPDVRSIAMGVLIEAGPRNEIPEQSGLAHLAEHVMFQGTSNRDAMEIARVIDVAGGQMGGFTTRDYTCYMATVLDDYRTYALGLLGDMLLNSIFPPENLEREKQAILREIATSRDLPNERAHALLKATAWSGHPLGRPISGRPETVKPLTREDVIYFVHEQYLPERMIIAAAGNVEHDDFVSQARDAFWRMLGQYDPALTFLPFWRRVKGDRPIFKSGIALEHMPVSQVYFSLGLRAHPYAHPDRYALHVISSLLGGGISSRLFRRIREERGLVYDINSEYHAYADDGLLLVEGSTAPEYIMQVLGLTLNELWKLLTGEDPIDEEELLKATMHIRGQHMIASENTNTRMSRLATQELYFGRYIPGEEVLKKIEAVDTRLLERIGNEALTGMPEQMTIAVIGPETPEHYNTTAIEEIVMGFQV